MSPTEPDPNPSDTWPDRFFGGFIAGALPAFIWILFYPPGETLIISAIAAVVVGSIFGILAAAFGKRMLDFLMSIHW